LPYLGEIKGYRALVNVNETPRKTATAPKQRFQRILSFAQTSGTGAIERAGVKGLPEAEHRITLFFFGISLFSLDKPSEQGYISAPVEKY
jgi:hypothetical protein